MKKNIRTEQTGCVPHRRTSLFMLGLSVLTLAGCEAAALTMFGVGASTGVQHSLNGVTYRTFTAPSSKVKSATLVALGRMSIKVDKSTRQGADETILAKAADRSIEVELQSLSPTTTRMRTVAKQGIFYDNATAYEIIAQTEKVLGS